jgi:hypothetical protein
LSLPPTDSWHPAEQHQASHAMIIDDPHDAADQRQPHRPTLEALRACTVAHSAWAVDHVVVLARRGRYISPGIARS